MGLGRIGFGFAAGVLSILSPCVVPLLPLLLAAAASAHRWGAAALAAGLALSFVAIGLFVATVGFSLGLTGDVFRMVAAVLLALLGMVLLSVRLQTRLGVAMGGVGDAGNRLGARLPRSGLWGQLLLGLLLGAIWSPCVGPTLGAASVLAARGQDLAQVAVVMAAFAIGTALPLLAIGMASRTSLLRWRSGMLGAGLLGRRILGGVVLVVALGIITGTDRQIEAALVAGSPDWLTRLTTRF